MVTVTGTGIAKLNGITPTAAQFGVTGEGGQAVTVSVPATITMAGSGPNITVTTSATGSGVQTLSGALGAAGTLTVRVGGSFPLTSTTASGSYSGTFTVTVAYN